LLTLKKSAILHQQEEPTVNHERVRERNEQRRTGRVIAAITVLAFVLSACGVHVSADEKATLQACDSQSPLFKKAGTDSQAQTQGGIRQALATATQNANDLYAIAKENGSQINLADHRTTEVQINAGNLVLSFPPEDETPGATDDVTFHMVAGATQIPAATITCSAKDGIYLNGIYAALQAFDNEAQPLA
jgi:hypothetical protein